MPFNKVNNEFSLLYFNNEISSLEWKQKNFSFASFAETAHMPKKYWDLLVEKEGESWNQLSVLANVKNQLVREASAWIKIQMRQHVEVNNTDVTSH